MYKDLNISVLRNGYELTIGKNIELVFTSPEDLFMKIREYFEDPNTVVDNYMQRPNARYFDEYEPYRGETQTGSIGAGGGGPIAYRPFASPSTASMPPDQPASLGSRLRNAASELRRG